MGIALSDWQMAVRHDGTEKRFVKQASLNKAIDSKPPRDYRVLQVCSLTYPAAEPSNRYFGLSRNDS